MKKLPFWLALIASFLILCAPRLVRDGMFIDGIWYATIANNLAQGSGTFWNPHFTTTIQPVFHAHPPLHFWLESLLFQLWGDHFMIERLYCFITFFLSASLIVLIWREIFRWNEEIKTLAFLPLLFWLTNEDVYLGYSNNLIECTLGVTSLAAIYGSLAAWQRRQVIWAIFAGLMIFMGFITKGIVSAFPMVFFPILLFTLFPPQIKTVILYSSMTIGIPILLLLITLTYPPAYLAMTDWFETQIVASIMGTNMNEDFNGNFRTSHFHIIKRLAERLIPQFILSFFWIKYARRNCISIFQPHLLKWCVLFLLLGMAGSFPFVLTLKQNTYYLIPAVPYYSIAFSILLIKPLLLILNKIRISHPYFRMLTLSLGLLILGGIGFNLQQYGKIDRRAKDTLPDVQIIGEYLPTQTTVGCLTETLENNLYSYLARYYQISVDRKNLQNYPFLLIENTLDTIPPLYDPVALNTARFQLWRLRTVKK